MPETELKRIMIVEDDPDIREIIHMALRLVGDLTISMCSSGEECLQRVRGEKPQLILLDVMMPNMDGPTTLKNLRLIPEAASIPVIFITAKVQPHEVAAYRKLGVVDVISKPFDSITLPDEIFELWRKQRK